MDDRPAFLLGCFPLFLAVLKVGIIIGGHYNPSQGAVSIRGNVPRFFVSRVILQTAVIDMAGSSHQADGREETGVPPGVQRGLRV